MDEAKQQLHETKLELHEELEELEIKITEVVKIIKSIEITEPPYLERRLIILQYHSMRAYSDALVARIALIHERQEKVATV